MVYLSHLPPAPSLSTGHDRRRGAGRGAGTSSGGRRPPTATPAPARAHSVPTRRDHPPTATRRPLLSTGQRVGAA
eukprot:1242515-Rhodomonas_salina.1